MNLALTRAWAAYLLRRLGLPGWLGIALLTASAIYFAGGLLPMAGRLDRIESSLGAAGASPAGIDAAVGPADRIRAFYRDFPGEAGIPDILSRINAIAREQGLSLDAGEYAVTRSVDGQWERLRITLPLKGGYRPIRIFAGKALAELPSLSLESVSLRREGIGEATVAARLVFVLFLERKT